MDRDQTWIVGGRIPVDNGMGCVGLIFSVFLAGVLLGLLKGCLGS